MVDGGGTEGSGARGRAPNVFPDWPDIDHAALVDAIDAASHRPLQRSHEQLSRLASIGSIELSDSLTSGPQPTLSRIVRATTPLLPNCGGVSAILYDRRTETFVTSATTVAGQSDGESAVRVRRSRGATRFIVETGLPLYVQDIDRDPFSANSMLRETGHHCYVGMPIRSSRDTIGVMYAMARDVAQFDAEDLELLSVVTDRAAVVLQASREHEAISRLATHADLINSVGATLAATDDVEGVLEELLTKVAEALELDTIAIAPHVPTTEHGLTLVGRAPEPWSVFVRPHHIAEALVERVGRAAAYTRVVGRRPERVATLAASRSRPGLDERDRQTLDQLAALLTSVLDRAGAVAEIEASNAALAHFAQVASHDLRAPLTTVAGFLELLLETEDLSEEGRAYASASVAAATRMADTVASLLQHAQLGAEIEPVHIDLDALWAEVVGDLRAVIEDTSARVLTGPLGTVLADQAGLRIVLQNLLANALRYQRPGTPPRVAATVRATDDGWRFELRDEGLGVAESDRERVFELFARGTGRDNRGAGIGLATVRRIVEAHGGSVRLEANEPVGTVAVVELPHGAD